jgi:hypothetical protein
MPRMEKKSAGLTAMAFMCTRTWPVAGVGISVSTMDTVERGSVCFCFVYVCIVGGGGVVGGGGEEE